MQMKVGVMLPVGENEERPTPSWDEIRDIARRTEETGLNSVWLADHLLFRFPGRPTWGIHESWTLMAALAAATKRIELGTLVTAMPFRNPALLAKMAATVEGISHGRLVLGIGCGWHDPEFEAFGYPTDHLVSRFEESLEILLPMVRHGRADFRGRYHVARDAELRPPASVAGRAAGPPILIAAKGPRMLRLVARHADAWNTAWLGPVDELEARLAPLREALAAEGRDPATLEITVGVTLVFPELAGDRRRPERAIVGSVEEVGEQIGRYASAGVGHLIVSSVPRSAASVERLAEATALARRSVRAAV